MEQLDLYRLIADIGLQATDLLFVLVMLARLQCRLAAGEKVIAPAGDGAAVTPSSLETTSMSLA